MFSFSLASGLCAVCPGLLGFLLSVSVRLYSVIMALPRRLMYYFVLTLCCRQLRIYFFKVPGVSIHIFVPYRRVLTSADLINTDIMILIFLFKKHFFFFFN